MVAPFNQAWMLLKQRGHELNLPPPRIMGDNPDRSLSPQDLTDRRVNAASKQKQADEDYFERLQGDLDRQTLARMGQQPKADEMEAMGMPEMDETGMPMSRTLGGTPPPNIGRAGSSGLPPVGSDDVRQELSHYLSGGYPAYTRALDKFGPSFNPFPKPLAGRVQDQLAAFADGAGRRAAMKPPMDDKPSMNEESHPEAHNIKRKV